jgi:hypothetical protein
LESRLRGYRLRDEILFLDLETRFLCPVELNQIRALGFEVVMLELQAA